MLVNVIQKSESPSWHPSEFSRSLPTFVKHHLVFIKHKHPTFIGKAWNTTWNVAGICLFAVHQPAKLQSCLNLALLAVLTSSSSVPRSWSWRTSAQLGAWSRSNFHLHITACVAAPTKYQPTHTLSSAEWIYQIRSVCQQIIYYLWEQSKRNSFGKELIQVWKRVPKEMS